MTRVYLTGATGFVGSNLVRVLTERHGAELFCPVHRHPAPRGAPYASAPVDLTDAGQVRRSIEDFRPDAVVHTAILNDPAGLRADRRASWEAYVGATRNVAAVAADAGALTVLISTDWVFDGTQVGATEDEPPNPVNLYGFLKAASELVVHERAGAAGAAVARVAGVQGVHWARPATPRRQDAGFGYLVASLAQALSAGRRFTVWQDPRLNTVASPTLASDAAEMVWRIVARGLTGTFHCCGGEAVDRAGLAHRAVEAFGLDPALLRSGTPPAGELPGEAVPYDTSLDATATAAALGHEPPSLDAMLARLRHQLETGALGAPDHHRPREPA